MKRGPKEELFLRNPAACPAGFCHAPSVPPRLKLLHHLKRAAGERIPRERARPRSVVRCDRPSQRVRRQLSPRDAAFANLSLTGCARLNAPRHESSPDHVRALTCGADQGRIKANSYIIKTNMYQRIN